jgi:hypothetical protein
VGEEWSAVADAPHAAVIAANIFVIIKRHRPALMRRNTVATRATAHLWPVEDRSLVLDIEGRRGRKWFAAVTAT